MHPNEDTIRNAARDAISQMVGRKIRDNERFISSGLIDSLSVLRLIGELEKRLNISIPTESLQPEDFDDLNLIVETVNRAAGKI